MGNANMEVKVPLVKGFLAKHPTKPTVEVQTEPFIPGFYTCRWVGNKPWQELITWAAIPVWLKKLAKDLAALNKEGYVIELLGFWQPPEIREVRQRSRSRTGALSSVKG